MIETIETGYTHSSKGDTLSNTIKFCFHDNTLFSCPPGCFQYSEKFQPRKIKPGQEGYLKLTLARSGKSGITEKYQNGTTKEARKASTIWMVWNPASCLGDIIDYLIL